MAAGDFLDIQNQLAKLAGRPTAADLDDDLDLCKQVINEAYLECYLMPDGTRPPWARLPIALQYRAPVGATLGVTLGSKVITGYAFTTDQVGSTVAIGTNRYRYAGLNGSSHEFLEPVTETTGNYAATVYHDQQPMGASQVDIIGKPELKNSGLLAPMSNRETETMYRSNHRGDFHPAAGAGYYGAGNGSYFGMNFESGKPLYFRVESGSMRLGAAIQERLCIYPAPAQIETVTFDANIVPTELSGDADRPLLKGDLVTRILLPIARAEWASIYKKFAAEPATLQKLQENGMKARSLLRTLSATQHRFSGRAIAGR